jgi:hypothetical protein
MLGTSDRTIAKKALQKEQKEQAMLRQSRKYEDTVENFIVQEAKPFGSFVFTEEREDTLFDRTISDNDIDVT